MSRFTSVAVVLAVWAAADGFVCTTRVAASPILLNLTADPANSSPSFFGGNLGGTLNDPFAYDPANPTSPLPDQVYSSNGDGFHAQQPAGTDAILSYTLTDGPLTLNGNVNFDLYGRNGFVNRDNDIDIQLFNGDYVTPVAELTGLAISDTAPFFVRGTLPLSGTTFDRVRLVAGDSNGGGNPNFFTLLELRANVEPVPEPTSLLVCGVGLGMLGVGVARRRTRARPNE